MVKLVPLLFVLVATAACVSIPESYPVPPQSLPALASMAPRGLRNILAMHEASTDDAIVQDIPKGERSAWRWAGTRPTVRMYTTGTAGGYKFHLQYAIAEVTLKQTGPVNLRFFVNDKFIGQEAHSKPGTFTVEKSIPDGILQPASENALAVEVDKPFIAEQDGAKLGFILTAIGLVR